MASKPLAKLFNLQVSLTTDGNILVNYEGPPNPDDLERAFDEYIGDKLKRKVTTGLNKTLDGIRENIPFL